MTSVGLSLFNYSCFKFEILTFPLRQFNSHCVTCRSVAFGFKFSAETFCVLWDIRDFVSCYKVVISLHVLKPQFLINTYLIVQEHELNLHECQQHSGAGSEYQHCIITVGFSREMLSDLQPRIHHASNTESYNSRSQTILRPVGA